MLRSRVCDPIMVGGMLSWVSSCSNADSDVFVHTFLSLPSWEPSEADVSHRFTIGIIIIPLVRHGAPCDCSALDNFCCVVIGRGLRTPSVGPAPRGHFFFIRVYSVVKLIAHSKILHVERGGTSLLTSESIDL
jgi:hypothetical protein